MSSKNTIKKFCDVAASLSGRLVGHIFDYGGRDERHWEEYVLAVTAAARTLEIDKIAEAEIMKRIFADINRQILGVEFVPGISPGPV
jgi:hypothetical protein